RRGDHLLAVNDLPYSGLAVLAVATRNAAPGDVLKITFSRGGEVQAAMVVVPSRPRVSWLQLIVNFVTPVSNPFPFIALGFFVAFQRPFDRMAWILLFLLVSFSQASGGARLLEFANTWDDFMRPVAAVYSILCIFTWPVWMLWFGTFFI